MNPKLRSLAARVVLVGGVAAVAALVARSAPHDQTIAIRLGSRQVTRLAAVVIRVGENETRVGGTVTRHGDSEATVGFSQDFPGASPSLVRHAFSAPNGTYIVVISLHEAPSEESSGAVPPIVPETSFERRVTLVGGEVIVSPD